MWEDIGQREITYTDAEGRLQRIRYCDLLIDLGQPHKLSLEECLREEGRKVRDLQRDAKRLAGRIESLTPLYRKYDRTSRAWHAECRRRTADVHDLSHKKRLKKLNTYFCIDRHHGRVLDDLEEYVLAGSEGDHSEHIKSLIRFTIDYTTCVMKDVVRKTGRPCALHSLAAASGVARNAQNHVTIIGTLLHDVLEERVDVWTDRFVREQIRTPRYAPLLAEVNPKTGKIPGAIRQRILLDNWEEYNNRAAAIFFAIGLALFDHIRKFPQPERYYQTLNSIMEMVEKLSRTRDLSYYQYLQLFVYPRRGEPDTIRRADLVRILAEEFEDPGLLLDEYLENVDGFYQTPSGEFMSREELKKNALREILAKITDRMNNTRDMDREHGFSIPARLYGAGFKNLYFVQALEDRMALPGMPTNERRLINVKFIKKPTISALWQITDDLDYLERERFGRAYIDMLEDELEKYKQTPQFRKLTPPQRGGLFDGTIYFFNEVILGNKDFLKQLESQPDKQAEYLVVFRAVLEAYLLYPALMEEEAAADDGRPDRPRLKRYRIQGMGPRLGRRVEAGEHPADEPQQLPVKTFRRRVID